MLVGMVGGLVVVYIDGYDGNDCSGNERSFETLYALSLIRVGCCGAWMNWGNKGVNIYINIYLREEGGRCKRVSNRQ